MEVIRAFMGVSTNNFIRSLNLIDREFGGMSSYLENQLLLTSADLFSRVPLAQEKEVPMDLKALLLNRL